MKKTLTLALTSIIALATACGTENDSSLKNDSQIVPAIETINEGDFKMYDQANVSPETFCDLHTILKLTNTSKGMAASLENGLEGICEIAVIPNVRNYELQKLGTSCGSVIYIGTLIGKAEHAAPTIEITDHRTRVCRDIVPAAVIVKQNFSETLTSALYSHDKGVNTLISLEGTLMHIMAIGGETTGYGLLLENGDLVEIALNTNDLRIAFAEDKKVTILGNYETVRGVEIPVRQVFVVTSMTVN